MVASCYNTLVETLDVVVPRALTRSVLADEADRIERWCDQAITVLSIVRSSLKSAYVFLSLLSPQSHLAPSHVAVGDFCFLRAVEVCLPT